VWQTIVYLVVVLVVVVIITSTILIIWNKDQIRTVIRERLSVEAETVAHISPALALVQMMQQYFFTTLWPAFLSFRRADTASLAARDAATSTGAPTLQAPKVPGTGISASHASSFDTP